MGPRVPPACAQPSASRCQWPVKPRLSPRPREGGGTEAAERCHVAEAEEPTVVSRQNNTGTQVSQGFAHSATGRGAEGAQPGALL